jgi:hypothetical protein
MKSNSYIGGGDDGLPCGSGNKSKKARKKDL